jgi:hypothetical protein
MIRGRLNLAPVRFAHAPDCSFAAWCRVPPFMHHARPLHQQKAGRPALIQVSSDPADPRPADISLPLTEPVPAGLQRAAGQGRG